MPRRKPVPKFTAPLSPEPPVEPLVGEHSSVVSFEEWEDECVADSNLAGEFGDRVRLTRCELHRVVLTGAQLRGLALVDVLAVDCELSGAFLAEATLRRVEFRNCRMTGVVMTQATLSHVRLVDSKLDGANLRLAHAEHVHMIDCSLVDADFYEATLAKSALEGCDLSGTDFAKASVGELRLGRSKLDRLRGALSMGGVVVAGDQVVPLALSLFAELRIEIQNEEV